MRSVENFASTLARHTARSRSAARPILVAMSSSSAHKKPVWPCSTISGAAPSRESEHRSAAGERFDHHQPERFGPADRVEQRCRAAEQIELVPSTNLPDVDRIAVRARARPNHRSSAARPAPTSSPLAGSVALPPGRPRPPGGHPCPGASARGIAHTLRRPGRTETLTRRSRGGSRPSSGPQVHCGVAPRRSPRRSPAQLPWHTASGVRS